MRVAILTSGRFHVLDLARELHRLGHDVDFYSLVPPSRTRPFGLPDRCNRWLGPLAGPAWLAHRALAGTALAPLASRALAEALDLAASRLLRPCDAFIGMSGMCLYTLARARRLGAVTFVERGSMHIEAQKAILDAQHPDRPSTFPRWVVDRERREYDRAHYISIPSRHAEDSFIERGFDRIRLLHNPYGVSLTEFPPTPTPPDPPRVLMVGRFSWQKGADVLVAAMERVRQTLPTAELRHVGPLGDVPFPAAPWATHLDPIPQAELTHAYAGAHAFALASRQDGLAVVQAQALASGLPLVCTTHTGGADLAALLDDAPVTVVPPADPDALAQALLAALARRGPPGSPRAAASTEARQALTWRAYGERWSRALAARVPPAGARP